MTARFSIASDGPLREYHPVHAADAPTSKIALDRQNWAGTAFLAALLLWPLVIFGRPAYFIDSLSYLRGGAFAVQYAVTKVQPTRFSLEDLFLQTLNQAAKQGRVGGEISNG